MGINTAHMSLFAGSFAKTRLYSYHMEIVKYFGIYQGSQLLLTCKNLLFCLSSIAETFHS